MDLSKSLRLQDLASNSRGEEWLDLNRALHQSNRVAAQLKSSLALVLERESSLIGEKEELEKQLNDARKTIADLKDEAESLRVCFDHAKTQMEVATEGEEDKFRELDRLRARVRLYEDELASERQQTHSFADSLKVTESELDRIRKTHAEAFIQRESFEAQLSQLTTEKQTLETLLSTKEKEHQTAVSKLKEQLTETIRRSKDQFQGIEKKIQAVHADHSRWAAEKQSLAAEVARLSDESSRKSEERKRLTEMYEEKLKEMNEELLLTRKSQENTAFSLTELLDKHEELERDYQDAVFHVEELQAQLRASQHSLKQLEESLDQQTSKIRQAMTESTLKYEEKLSSSDVNKLRLHFELTKSQTIESERLKERSFFLKVITALLQMPRIPQERLTAIIDNLSAIPIEDAETLLKFVAKIPSMAGDEQSERRLRVVLKLSEAGFSSPDGKSIATDEKTYTFDRVFSAKDKVEQVYEEVTLLTDAFSQGFSSCVYVFGRTSFMFNNMVHRTLLSLFKNSPQEFLLRVSEGGDEPNYEQRVSTYAGASKVLETAAKGWRQSQQHVVLSLQHISSKQCLFFASLNTEDHETIDQVCEALVSPQGAQSLPPHLLECVERMTLGLCILTVDGEEAGREMLEIGGKLIDGRTVVLEDGE